MNITSFWTSIQNGLSASERVFALIDTPTRVVQTASDPVPPLERRDRYSRMSAFHYKESEQILDDFNLKIAAGENLAIVGHTGAGKTSIAKLIARFYEFQSGQLLVDGHDIRIVRPGGVPPAFGRGLAGTLPVFRHSGGEYPLRRPAGEARLRSWPGEEDRRWRMAGDVTAGIGDRSGRARRAAFNGAAAVGLADARAGAAARLSSY